MSLEFGAAEVAQAAGEAAAALAQQGLGAGDTIAWLGLNDLRLPALLAACRERGARVVPLNWRLADAELAHQLVQAEVQALWHDEAMAARAAGLRAAAALPRPRTADHRPGDLLLAYTSGTTGGPRAAVHTAEGMDANLRAAIDAQGLTRASRVLAVLPLFHVGGLCIQLLPGLAAGARIRLHPRFDAEAWLRDVAAWRPTTSLLVPAAMKAVVEHPLWAGTDLSSLAFLNSGSQVVPVPLIEAFHARGVPVAQVYGATETGPVSLVLRPEEALSAVGCCGRPALGVQARLGEGGELLLRGANLMRGYHGQADSGLDAEGWWHSGDLARQHADGRYEIVGRRKELIISGGENIHPSEIENLLAGQPGIAECCVVGLPDARWGEVPVLALVAAPGAAPDEASLRALFDARLARFKHPRRIVWLPSLPRTALGKVQRAELARQLS